MTRSTEGPPPKSLEVHRFEVGDDSYALFAFDIPRPDLPTGLTAIERQLVAAILEGRTNEEIAQSRKRSVRTIANQLATVYRKLGVEGRAGIVARCRWGAP